MDRDFRRRIGEDSSIGDFDGRPVGSPRQVQQQPPLVEAEGDGPSIHGDGGHLGPGRKGQGELTVSPRTQNHPRCPFEEAGLRLQGQPQRQRNRLRADASSQRGRDAGESQEE